MCVRVYGGCITEKHPRRGRARIRIRRAAEIRARHTTRARTIVQEICIIREQRNVSKSNDSNYVLSTRAGPSHNHAAPARPREMANAKRARSSRVGQPRLLTSLRTHTALAGTLTMTAVQSPVQRTLTAEKNLTKSRSILNLKKLSSSRARHTCLRLRQWQP